MAKFGPNNTWKKFVRYFPDISKTGNEVLIECNNTVVEFNWDPSVMAIYVTGDNNSITLHNYFFDGTSRGLQWRDDEPPFIIDGKNNKISWNWKQR